MNMTDPAISFTIAEVEFDQDTTPQFSQEPFKGLSTPSFLISPNFLKSLAENYDRAPVRNRSAHDYSTELHEITTQSALPAVVYQDVVQALTAYNNLNAAGSYPPLQVSFIVPETLPPEAERYYAWLNVDRGEGSERDSRLLLRYYFNFPLIEQHGTPPEGIVINELTDAAYLVSRLNAGLSLQLPFPVALALALNETNHPLRESFMGSIDRTIPLWGHQVQGVERGASVQQRSIALSQYLATQSEQQRRQLIQTINLTTQDLMDEYIEQFDGAQIERGDSPESVRIRWFTNGEFSREEQVSLPQELNLERLLVQDRGTSYLAGYQERILSDARQHLNTYFGVEAPLITNVTIEVRGLGMQSVLQVAPSRAPLTPLQMQPLTPDFRSR